MTPLKNDCFLRAVRRLPVSRTPVWMMRQAGRYLPEYRKVREKAGSFLNLCTNPELACEVTMQPLERFRFDAAILFSDILTVPDAMGLGLSFAEGEGPMFARPIRTQTDIDRLPVPDPEVELSYVMDAVRLISRTLDGSVPLIGFAGSPWTLATYMVEGGASKNFRWIKTLMYQHPEAMHRLLEKLAESVGLYLSAQVAAGAQAIMLFDTWGGILSTEDYLDFSLFYAKKVLDKLNDAQMQSPVPTILFTKGGGQWLDSMADSGFSGLGLDWTCDISSARDRVGDRVALQGNMDPLSLYASESVIRRKVNFILNKYGNGTGHVFNLGHGILPDVDPYHVEAMVEAVHEYSPSFHVD